MRAKIEDILKEKYDEVEVPDELFDLDKILKDVEPLKKKNNLPKYIVSLVVVIIISCGIALYITNVNSNKESVTQQVGNMSNSVLPNYVGEIEISKEHFTVNPKRENSFYIVKVNSILGYDTLEVENIKYPVTKVNAEVLDVVQGEDLKEIEFYIPGGVMSVEEIKNSNLPYNEDELSEYNLEDNLMVNYYELFPIATIEEGKTYMTTVYQEDNELYVNEDFEYGFVEYNQNDGMVKLDDGKWIKPDLEK